MVLNTLAMQEDFFEDTAMLGIATGEPAHRLCWLVNQHFDIDFMRDPNQTIAMKKKDTTMYFPVYCYNLPNSFHKYTLYKLKNGVECLMPDVKQLDYLWLVQTSNAACDAGAIAHELKQIIEVQLVIMLDGTGLKHLKNLIV